MLKSNKMRGIVEAHLRQVNTLLKHADENDLTEAKQNYISQKLALEYVLREFDKIK